MSKAKPFPAITGSCICSLVRYRLLTSPLYVYACHCVDCQKQSGSAFGIYLTIEAQNLQIITPTPPVKAFREKKIPGLLVQHVECPRCKTELWSNSWIGSTVCDVLVGTLDFASLMEPDIHIYTDSKLDWIRLPDGAKTTPKDYKFRDHWPKSSLKRLDMCLAKAAEQKKRTEEALAAAQQNKTGIVVRQREDLDDAVGEGEKTPTATEPGDNDVEDDEAFERRYRETERALQERLEKLSLKLREEEPQAAKQTEI